METVSASALKSERNDIARAFDVPVLNDLINLHLRARPRRLPKAHADRAVTIVSAHPAAFTASYGYRYCLQKSFRCANTAHHPKHPKGTWETACDPDLGDWETASTVFLSEHGSEEVWLDELHDWVELLDSLAPQPNAAVVLGCLKTDAKRVAYNGRWLLGDKRSRYDDTPSRWLLVDLDHVSGEPEDTPGTLADYISETMPELSACAYVAAFSSSAGIKGARVRLVFELAEPRTLAAMRVFAQCVNARAGFEVIDSSLYTPGHLVITAAPQLFAQVAQGNSVTIQKLPRPVRSTAWYVDGDLAEIPDAVTSVTAGADYVPKGQRTEALTKAAAAELLQSLRPGNYSVNIYRWLCHVAWSAPTHRAQSAFNEAVSAIQDRIRETSEPARRDERLRVHGNPEALRRKWDAALQRKALLLSERKLVKAASVSTAPATPAGLSALRVSTAGALNLAAAQAASNTPVLPTPTIDNVRAQLKVDLVSEAKAISDGAKRHVLFTHAPGSGKTTGLLSVLDAGRLSSELTRIAMPTHALAEEVVATIKQHATTLGDQGGGWHYGQYLPALVRHHKGRSQPGMCPDAVSKPKADLAERMGMSVKKHVCPGCVTGKAGKCPWLIQADDDSNGVIVEVHHASSSPVERRADLMVYDEGTIGATVQSDPDTVAVQDLGKTDTIYAVREGNVLGAPMGRATIELNSYRNELLRGVASSVPKKEGEAGKLLTAAVPSLVVAVTFEARRGKKRETCTGMGAAHAIELESRLQSTLFARIANEKTPPAKRAAAETTLRISQAATRLYEAIDASAQRAYVFGIATYFKGHGKLRVDRVKCVTRAAQPARDASVSFDGTADVSVWQAIVSPNGAPFEQRVYGAAPEILAGALNVYQYADKAGALSSLVRSAMPTAAEAAANELRAQLLELSSRPWATAAYDDLAGQLAAANAVADAELASSDRKRRNADSTLRMLWRFLLTESVTHSSRAVPVAGKRVSTLLVAQKAVIERLRGLGLPSTVATVHFGALRGLNTFKDVPCCVVIGRPRPADIDLELMTEALHSHNPLVAEIARRTSGWSEEHPDPRVVSVQQVTAAAEVKQAVARIRPYDRSDANPCTLHVFGVYDIGLPAELVQIRAWSDADRSPVEVARAYGAVFSDPRLNEQAYGSLFPRSGADGGGLVGAEQRRKFAQLVSNLAHGFEGQKKLSAYLYIERRTGESEVPITRKHVVSDALSFAADGADSVPGRAHKLVKLRTGATRGPATLALVNANWTQAHVEQRLGCKVTAWIEQSAADALAIGGRGRRRPTHAIAAT